MGTHVARGRLKAKFIRAALFKDHNLATKSGKLSKPHNCKNSTRVAVYKMTNSMAWIEKVLSRTGFDYMCLVDEEFVVDKFNLTGLEREFTNFRQIFDGLLAEKPPGSDIYDSCLHLYGLIHARFILSPAGLVKMNEKFTAGHYGCCPRLLCRGNRLLPLGLSDRPGTCGVKLYCSLCEDVYSPKSSKHNSVDGVYFGTSFPHLFLMTYPPRDLAPYVKFQPLLFGFKCHQAHGRPEPHL